MKRYTFLMVGLVLGIVVTSAVTAAEPVVGKVAEVAGTVWVLPKDAELTEENLREIGVGESIQEGDTVATDLESTVRIDFEDDSIIKLAESSRCVIRTKGTTSEKDSTLNLFEGKMRVKVKGARVERGMFEVVTPAAMAVTRGGDFLVVCPYGGETKVFVFKGVVAVREVSKDIIVSSKHLICVGVREPLAVPVRLKLREIQRIDRSLSIGGAEEVGTAVTTQEAVVETVGEEIAEETVQEVLADGNQEVVQEEIQGTLLIRTLPGAPGSPSQH